MLEKIVANEIAKPNILKDIKIDKNIDIDKPQIKTPLTNTDKEKLQKETGWSKEIIDAISSKEEAEIYKKANLVEADINGKKCLIKSDINMEQKDEFARTNKERMQEGKAPLDKEGKPIELHHIGQKSDGSLAELTNAEHHKCGNDTILHDKNKESEIDRVAFGKERAQHWENRAENV